MCKKSQMLSRKGSMIAKSIHFNKFLKAAGFDDFLQIVLCCFQPLS
jgi:hypothetical protein